LGKLLTQLLARARREQQSQSRTDEDPGAEENDAGHQIGVAGSASPLQTERSYDFFSRRQASNNILHIDFVLSIVLC
jgi:hypothetical protein